MPFPIVVDESRWFRAWENTSLVRGNYPTPQEAAKHSGCCVKTRERDAGTGFPTMTGVLVSYDADADRVVVRGYGDFVSPCFVWEGSVRQYLSTWECD